MNIKSNFFRNFFFYYYNFIIIISDFIKDYEANNIYFSIYLYIFSDIKNSIFFKNANLNYFLLDNDYITRPFNKILEIRY